MVVVRTVSLVVGFMLLFAHGAASAAPYPTTDCVGAKQKEVGKYCKSALQAWAVWDVNQDTAKRDKNISKAGGKLDKKWTKAEDRSADQGVDCADTTGTSAATQTLIGASVTNIVNAVNGGLNLTNPADAKCGKVLIHAAAKKCLDFLKAESAHVLDLTADADRSVLNAALSEASSKFAKSWTKHASCPTTATQSGVEALVDGLFADVVRDTTVSPNVDDAQFTTYPAGPTDYLGRQFVPTCKSGTPYSYFAKRGSVNKLVIYYQGGGACWDQLTCSAGVCDASVDPTGGDNPNNATSGFANLSNPANPFRDWNIVFVPYCSCDVHFGDAAQDYPLHVEHRGYHNSRVVEKFAREHFVDPEQIFVTGSSAGAYGAWFNAPLHERVWPASQFQVLADAGNGVITQDFLNTNFPHWNFVGNLPSDIPGLADVLTNGTGIPGYTEVVANTFPNTRWAHYASAYDGGFGGQTSFYNIMLQNSPIGAITWWEGSCAFNAQMRSQALATAVAIPSNYRYYIGTGSRHTMWGSNKVYTNTTGGVPTLLDWVNGMLDGTGAWTNVECADCGLLLPGDPAPNPLASPFEQAGPDVKVVCSASGVFLDGAAGSLD